MVGDSVHPILSGLAEEAENGKDVRIYRLPHYLKKASVEDFEPLELSVGFYCHTSLKTGDPMDLDITKLAIAREFCRGPEPDGPPTAKLSPVYRPVQPEAWTGFVTMFDEDLMRKARRMYDRLNATTEIENHLVILDALFIVAFLQFQYNFSDCWGYEFKPVFERSRFTSQRFTVLRDLLMLENQVPMPLLRRVIHCIRRPSMKEGEEEMLYNLLEWFVTNVYPFNHGVKLDITSETLQQHMESSHRHGVDGFLDCKHLLDCAYMAICGPYSPTPDDPTDFCGQFLPCFKPSNVGPCDPPAGRNRFRIPSATSLRRVGISVKVRDDSLTMKNIKFVRQKHKYMLLVPKLIMSDNTASVLRNLAVYEQIRDDGFCIRGDIRTYLYLMSSLLDSVLDVRLLMNRGVIVNQLGSAEAVCKEWNKMCDGLYIPSNPPSYWTDIQKRISELEKSKSNKWFAEIEERNFSSMFVFVSFVAFCILFIATLLQTIYSMASYYTAA